MTRRGSGRADDDDASDGVKGSRAGLLHLTVSGGKEPHLQQRGAPVGPRGNEVALRLIRQPGA